MIFHYWFLNHGFKFQDSVCNGCQDLIMLNVIINDIAIIPIENGVYHCIIHDIRKSEALNFLQNYVFEDCEYI